MSRSKLTMTAVLLISLGGIASAEPPQHDSFDNRLRSSDPQVDGAALFRTTRVGECAAIERRVAAPPARERDAKRMRAEQRKTLANAGCSVVWTD